MDTFYTHYLIEGKSLYNAFHEMQEDMQKIYTPLD